jgi:hypothetical protein
MGEYSTKFEDKLMSLPVLVPVNVLNTKQRLTLTAIIVACKKVGNALIHKHNMPKMLEVESSRGFLKYKVDNYTDAGFESIKRAIDNYAKFDPAALPPPLLAALLRDAGGGGGAPVAAGGGGGAAAAAAAAALTEEEKVSLLDLAFTMANLAIAAADVVAAVYNRVLPGDGDSDIEKYERQIAAENDDKKVYDYNMLVETTNIDHNDPAAAAAAAYIYFIKHFIKPGIDNISGVAVGGILATLQQNSEANAAAGPVAESGTFSPAVQEAAAAAAAAATAARNAQAAKVKADADAAAYLDAKIKADADVAAASQKMGNIKKTKPNSAASAAAAESAYAASESAYAASLSELVRANEVSAAAEANVSMAAGSVYRKVKAGLSSIWGGVSSWFSGGGGRNKQLRNVIVNKIKRKSRKIKKLMVGKKSRRISKHRGKYGKMKKTMRGMVRRKTIKKLK